MEKVAVFWVAGRGSRLWAFGFGLWEDRPVDEEKTGKEGGCKGVETGW